MNGTAPSSSFDTVNYPFCGEPIWPVNIFTTHTGSIPNVSSCLQHTLLVYLPALYFFGLVPVFLTQITNANHARRYEPLGLSRIIIAKPLLAVLLIADAVALLILSFTDNSPPVNSVYPFLMATTAAGLAVAHWLCKSAGMVTSGIIFTSWLLFTICGLPEFIASLVSLFYGTDARAVGFLFWWLGCVFEVVLHANADPRPSDTIPNAEKDSSFLTRITFWWFTPLPMLGASRALEVEDLFPINEGNTTAFLEPVWNYFYQSSLRKYYAKKRMASSGVTTNLINGEVKILNGNCSSKAKMSSPGGAPEIPPPSVALALFKMFRFDFLGAMLIKIFADILQFANPWLLNALINYVSDPDAPLWRGIFFAICMFVTAELRSLLISWYFNKMFNTGIKVQTTLVAAVYRKSLRLCNSSRREKSTGEIVNLMAIDAERIQGIIVHIQQFWSSPFQITLALVFLYVNLGYSALPGVLITVLYIPYTVFTSKVIQKWMREAMKLRDKRTKMCNEVLNGIKVVKLYAWEVPLMQAIEAIREKELFLLLKGSLVRLTVDVFNWTTPFLVAFFSFTTFVFSDPVNHILTPQIAFVSLTLFNQLRSPFTMLGLLVNMMVDVLVSNQRIKDFLVADELDSDSVERLELPEDDSKQPIVECTKADFSWDGPDAALAEPHLSDISLKIEKRSLTAVVGRVGAGKSSLLAALLGEMDKQRGKVVLRGSVAYVPQQAWIQNMSLRDNILFGQPFKKRLYDRVLDACALLPDLAILPHGDSTEIGEKGINLSGGQKARIALARAVYQNCDVYFLDDPLSAVDSHVGRHIFNKVFGPRGLLRNKTRILVTHGFAFLRFASAVFVLEDGRIVENGPYDELLQIPNGKLAALASSSAFKETSDDNGSRDDSTVPEEEEGREDAGEDVDKVVDVIDIAVHNMLGRLGSTVSSLSRVHSDEDETEPRSLLAGLHGGDTDQKLIQDEFLERTGVKLSVYSDYVKAASIWLSAIYILGNFSYQGCIVLHNVWLSKWSDDNDLSLASSNHTAMATGVRLGVYGGIGVVEIFALAISLLCLAFAGLRASRNLHTPVLLSILRSPMSFFDTTPVGRVLNRLAKDVEVIDTRIPLNTRYFVMCVSQVFFTIIIICVSTPVFIPFIVPIGSIYYFSLKYYVPTSRQLRRLESTNRSPVFSHFGESLQGAAVIRAFGRTEGFCYGMSTVVDRSSNIRFSNLTSNRWLAVRLEFVGNIIVFCAALFAVISNYWGWQTSAGMVGLSVSYALNITEVLNFAVRQISELETNIVSVERLKEYTEIPSEAAWTIPETEPSGDWPTEGRVVFKDYATRYRPGLELAVRNISVSVAPCEKIGIVGRTGAGKSSLTLALFRMIEAAQGGIVIDDVVISRLGLHSLRSRITIIPQDPVLFSGSLRFNLDPFSLYDDATLWRALELAHLKDFVDGLRDGLEHEITEGGDNISVGQRQLVCLARALLRRSKVLVLDEATAAVDLTTDALIQNTIRTEFTNSTILTIAHRLNTIMDYDRVLVLDKGEVIEFDSPARLLADDSSVFSAMVTDAKTHQGQLDE